MARAKATAPCAVATKVRGNARDSHGRVGGDNQVIDKHPPERLEDPAKFLP